MIRKNMRLADHHDEIVRLAKIYSCKEVAKKLGINKDSLPGYGRRQGIKFNTAFVSGFYNGIPVDEIRAFAKIHTIKEIAEKYEFDEQAFRTYANINGIKYAAIIYNPKTPRTIKKHKRITKDEKEKTLIKLRRKFSNVYPEFKDAGRTIRYTGRHHVDNRVFETWDLLIEFAKSHI